MGARKWLPLEKPVVLFSWSYDFYMWPTDCFKGDDYGNILWDTHIYSDGMDTVEKLMKLYDKEMVPVNKFQERMGQKVLIGEFALSNLQADSTPENLATW